MIFSISSTMIFALGGVDLGFTPPLSVVDVNIDEWQIEALDCPGDAQRNERLAMELHRKANDRFDAAEMLCMPDYLSHFAGLFLDRSRWSEVDARSHQHG